MADPGFALGVSVAFHPVCSVISLRGWASPRAVLPRRACRNSVSLCGKPFALFYFAQPSGDLRHRVAVQLAITVGDFDQQLVAAVSGRRVIHGHASARSRVLAYNHTKQFEPFQDVVAGIKLKLGSIQLCRQFLPGLGVHFGIVGKAILIVLAPSLQVRESLLLLESKTAGLIQASATGLDAGGAFFGLGAVLAIGHVCAVNAGVSPGRGRRRWGVTLARVFAQPVGAIMSNLPLVNVTAQVNDQQGRPCAGAVVKMRLCSPDTRCIREQEAVSLSAIELRSGESLNEISETAAATRSEAVEAVKSTGQNAVHAVEDARDEALEDLREVGGQFEEDFLTLTERAESAAKRAGCSAAGAANSATKACACAERAEAAAQGIERHRDDALDAARRAETAQACAESAAQRAESAADMSQQNADYAAGSAKAAQEAAKAADASADLAKQSADMAVAAQQATANDKAYVESVADDVEQAVRDVAVDMLTPQVITEAVERATADAASYAQAAAESAGQSATSATEAERQVSLAAEQAARAEAAQGDAETAAERAEAAADSAMEKAEDIIAHMADGMSASWTIAKEVNEGELLTLPEGCGYYPDHHAVRLSWDGLICHQNRQWEEVGGKGVFSKAIRLLFSAPADSDFEISIAAHADVPGAGATGAILEERFTRLEDEISSLREASVGYSELAQA